jgi:N-acetylmuramoyl-L-alanine amidase
MKRGQEVTTFGTVGDWEHVFVNGIEGYVFARYLAREKDGAATSPQSAQTAQGSAGKAGAHKVAIDPGHQAKANNGLEPIGPGADEKKAKVSSGTSGVSSKALEYKLTLAVAFKLRDELKARGYDVYMVRETHDVDISNKERALKAKDSGSDIFVRIHANGSSDSGVNGILTLCQTKNNPYVSGFYEKSRALADNIVKSMVSAAGAKSRGVSEVDNMSGINWSSMPVAIVEMGFMTNPSEDKLMQTDEYQRKLVSGMANGIDLYFEKYLS